MTTDEAFRAYMDAIEAGDHRRAFAFVDEALRAGLDVRALYMEVFQPSLREVGRLWQDGEMTVADEHLATAITQGAMAHVYDALIVAGADSGPLLLAAGAEAERHDVGLRMLADLLEMEGWRVVYLGSSVPIDSLVAMVREKKPAVLALSASLAPHAPQIRLAIRSVRDAMGKDQPLIIVGGRPFLADPDLAERVGADLTARDAVEAVDRLSERLR